MPSVPCRRRIQSVQRNEERKTDAKHNKGNQQMAVGKDCLGLRGKCHQYPVAILLLDLGQHTGAAFLLSTWSLIIVLLATANPSR
jgi:hypothetical protein